ncbi:hypothetical protein PHLGIDRAFT_54407, partial [Phlebiopsis gigantea 11061_1 CR5-6]
MVWGRVCGPRTHKCATCKIPLLTGEESGFCCGPRGSRFDDVLPLPPLPTEFKTFLNHPDISRHSRTLNLLFSFASMETTAVFPEFHGSPAFVAIQGKVYHR